VLNQILKFTLFTSLWMWLRPRWRGLLALAVFIGLVTLGHREYLDYVTLSGDKNFLIWSYAVKWLLIATGLLAYFLLVVMWPKPRKTRAGKTTGGKGQAAVVAGEVEDDGFDFLRNKKRLQNRAEKLLDEK